MTKSYDNLARCYAWLERLVFGNLLARVRQEVLCNLLTNLQAGQRVLILGEGDGRFLQYFSRQCQVVCEVDCVDKSKAMLARARARLANNTLLTVNFIHADVTCDFPTNSQYDTPYDAVVSLFFLDNFNIETLEHLTHTISYQLRAGGYWYMADFRVGKQRRNNRFLLWVMYRFFRLTTDIEARSLVDPTKWLEQHLTLSTRRPWQGGFVVSETWQRQHKHQRQHEYQR